MKAIDPNDAAQVWTLVAKAAKSDNQLTRQLGVFLGFLQAQKEIGPDGIPIPDDYDFDGALKWPAPMLSGIMIVCPECGNKRCPKATDHNLDCTGSNAPGQPGSRFA
jgi:hypothetical protein